jgi:USP6 N-terminal-like protein
MKNLARQYSPDLRQIDLDINRTFRDNIAYRVRYCQRLVNVKIFQL